MIPISRPTLEIKASYSSETPDPVAVVMTFFTEFECSFPGPYTALCTAALEVGMVMLLSVRCAYFLSLNLVMIMESISSPSRVRLESISLKSVCHILEPTCLIQHDSTLVLGIAVR